MVPRTRKHVNAAFLFTKLAHACHCFCAQLIENPPTTRPGGTTPEPNKSPAIKNGPRKYLPSPPAGTNIGRPTRHSPSSDLLRHAFGRVLGTVGDLSSTKTGLAGFYDITFNSSDEHLRCGRPATPFYDRTIAFLRPLKGQPSAPNPWLPAKGGAL